MRGRPAFLLPNAIGGTIIVAVAAFVGEFLGGWRCIGDDPSNATSLACEHDVGTAVIRWATISVFVLVSIWLDVFAIKRDRGWTLIIGTILLAVIAFFGNALFWEKAGA